MTHVVIVNMRKYTMIWRYTLDRESEVVILFRGREKEERQSVDSEKRERRSQRGASAMWRNALTLFESRRLWSEPGWHTSVEFYAYPEFAPFADDVNIRSLVALNDLVGSSRNLSFACSCFDRIDLVLEWKQNAYEIRLTWLAKYNWHLVVTYLEHAINSNHRYKFFSKSYLEINSLIRFEETRVRDFGNVYRKVCRLELARPTIKGAAFSRSMKGFVLYVATWYTYTVRIPRDGSVYGAPLMTGYGRV